MTLYQKVEQFVKDSFVKVSKQHSVAHLMRTAYWAKVLKPDIDEAVLIAAVAHDIERPFRSKEDQEKLNKIWLEYGFIKKEFLDEHQKQGAEIITEFLSKQGVDRELINRVYNIVLRHEFGGDEDSDLVKDADSISFFENNGERFAGKYTLEFGKQKVKEKLDWMYDRITDPMAKQIAEPFYKKYSRLL